MKSYRILICLSILLKLLFLVEAVPGVAVPPSWRDTPWIKTGSYKIIDGNICSCITDSTPIPAATATLTYPTSFSVSPNLAYGIHQYEGIKYYYSGDSNLVNQKFQIISGTILSTSFTVIVNILETTSLWIMEIRYIAIDKTIPYHINSFRDVPVNSTNGNLINITSQSLTTTTYTNIINYNIQASSVGSPYTSFNNPLTNYIIAPFLTTLHLTGTPETTSVLYPIKLKIQASPYSTTQYKVVVTFGYNAQITKLHLSLIIYDKVQIRASNQYSLIYEKTCYTSTGGFYSVPGQSRGSFMIGFIQFSSTRTASVTHFINEFGSVSGDYGTTMYLSQPRNIRKTPLSRFCYTYLYMRRWRCPAGIFFDDLTNLCNICGKTGCIECIDTTQCRTCATSLNYFLDGAGGCALCTIPGCIQCSSLTTCQTCDSQQNYYLLPNGTCAICPTSLYSNPSSQNCEACSIPGCITCITYSTCETCNTTQLYYVNQHQTCAYCDQALGQFMDPVTFQCILCPVSNCKDCLTITTCQQCLNGGYYLNQTDSQCYPCVQQECLTCLNEIICTGVLLHVQVLNIEKSGCNSMKIVVRIPHFTLDQIPQTFKILNNQVYITQTVQNGSQIIIYADYTRNIINQTIIIQFSINQTIILLNLHYITMLTSVR